MISGVHSRSIRRDKGCDKDASPTFNKHSIMKVNYLIRFSLKIILLVRLDKKQVLRKEHRSKTFRPFRNKHTN